MNPEQGNNFWPRNKTITPADIQGDYPLLSDALANEGWPLLEDSRGKAIFVLLATGGMREIYLQHILQGQFRLVQTI